MGAPEGWSPSAWRMRGAKGAKGGYDHDGGGGGGRGRGTYDRGSGGDRGNYGDRDSYGSSDRGYDRGGKGGYGRSSGSRDYDEQASSVGARAIGVGRVSALKDGYGFIDPDDMALPRQYFHFREVRDGKQPHVGDEVRYIVDVDRRSGREQAVRVDVLPPGTLPKPTPPPEVVLVGVVERAGREGGRIVQGAPLPAEGGGVVSLAAAARLSSVGINSADGATSEQPPTPRGTVYTYGASDAPRDGPPLQEGDLVEFRALVGAAAERAAAAADERGGVKGGKPARKALGVKLLVAGGGLARFRGAIASLKEHYGFLRQADAPSECFFHYSELSRELREEMREDAGGPDSSGGELRVGDEIEFCKAKDPRSGKECATRLVRLAPGSVEFDLVLTTARCEGIVATAFPAPATADGGDGAGRSAILSPSASRADKLASGGVLSALVATRESAAVADSEGEEAATEDAAEGIGAAAPTTAPTTASREAAMASRLPAALAHLPADVLRAPSAKERFGFGARDLDETLRAEGVYEGDRVEFCLAVEKSSGQRGAAHIRLLRPNWQCGIVASVRERDRYARVQACMPGHTPACPRACAAAPPCPPAPPLLPPCPASPPPLPPLRELAARAGYPLAPPLAMTHPPRDMMIRLGCGDRSVLAARSVDDSAHPTRTFL